MVNKMPELGVPKLPTQTPTWQAGALKQPAEACPKGRLGPRA